VRRERRWMLLTWASLACAVLTKGVAALVLAGGTVVVYSMVTRDLRVWRQWHVATGLAILLLISVPWFVIVTLRNPEFPGFFFIHEHVARFLTTVDSRTGPWWYFLPLTLAAVAPWIASLRTSLRVAWRGGSKLADPAETRRLLLVWCSFVLVFFSISQSKLPPYIVPAMPALSVLLGLAIAADASATRRASWINSALIALLTAALAGYAWYRIAALPPQMLAWLAVALLAATCGVLFIHWNGERWFEPPRAVGFACTSIVAWQALIMSYVELPPVHTAVDLVRTVRPFIAPGESLYSVDEYRQSVPPYLGRTLRLVDYRGEFDFGLSHDVVPYIPTLDAFMIEWQGRTDAVAFVSSRAYVELVWRGAPMRTLASDDRSVVVSRR
jgi:4-amino-4-deoxy-L-arabinose transferase-like glycosyltransferase